MVLLQILLRSEWRTPQGVEDVKRILESLGITPTGQGSATISAELDPELFEKLFGASSTSLGLAEKDLAVPPELQRHLQSISVAPPHIYLNERQA